MAAKKKGALRPRRKSLGKIKLEKTMRKEDVIPEVEETIVDESGKEVVAVGIDLGTTNSAVAVFDARALEPRIIPVDGQDLLPSVVWFKSKKDESGEPTNEIEEIVVGHEAINAEEAFPKEVVRSVKTQMGEQKFDRPILDKEYAPEEISAKMLEKILKTAEADLGKKVTHAVITVPANFTEPQRGATKKAGGLAGLKEKNIQILAEPSAAGFAYILSLKKERKANILVYDLGGGTFDVVVLKMIGDTESGLDFEIIGQAGNNRLGGDDFDIAIAKFLAEDIKKQSQGKFDVFDTKADTGLSKTELMVIQSRLKKVAEKAKIELSDKYVASTEEQPNPTTEIAVKNAAQDADGNTYNLNFDFSCQQMKDLINDTIQGTKEVIQAALDDAGLTKEDINRIILVGGSTKLPMVRDLVVETLGKEAYANVNPSTAVAAGAAVVAFGVKPPSEISNIGIGLKNLEFDLLIDGEKEKDTLPYTIIRKYVSSKGLAFVEIHLYKTDNPTITSLEPGREKFIGKLGVDNLDPSTEEEIEVTFTMNPDKTIDLKVTHGDHEYPATFTSS